MKKFSILLLIAFFVGGYLITKNLNTITKTELTSAHTTDISNKIPDQTPDQEKSASKNSTTQNNQELKDSINTIVTKYPQIKVSISALDLQTGNKFTLDPDKTSIGASTTKLFTASTFLTQIEAGKQNYTKLVGAYDAKFEFEQMVNQSNNDAWVNFYDLLGRKNIEDYAHSVGATNFDISENTLTSTDMLNYLTKLYQNELHSKENTKYLMSLMQNTEDSSFVPVKDTEFKIYHKNGKLEGVVNEAVIAVKDDNAKLIAIYTDGEGVWEYEDRRVLFNDIIKNLLKDL